MPSYELVVLLQKLERPALKEALKRSAHYIYDFDGIIRRMENLGLRTLPYFIRNKGKKHGLGHFFVFTYDSVPETDKPLKEKFRLDVDVVRVQNWLLANSPFDLHGQKEKPECTLHEDLLPPPLRKNVIEMQRIGDKNKNKKKNAFKGTNFEDPEYMIF